jgi:hypothetical protein
VPRGHAGQCWPDNSNDVIVARHTVTHLSTSSTSASSLGDGGYRGITSITSPPRDPTGRIVHDDHYRIRARVEHVIARLKDWQILRQCRRRARPSTTVFKSTQDSGTSRHTPNYGPPLSAVARPAGRHNRARSFRAAE